MSDWKVGDRGRLTADFTVTQVKSNVWVRFDSFTYEYSFSGAAMTEENGVVKTVPPYVPQIGDYVQLLFPTLEEKGVLRQVVTDGDLLWRLAGCGPLSYSADVLTLVYRPEVSK